VFAVGTPPDSAVSNLSKWAELFHISLPNFLKTKTADNWIVWIGLILIVLYIVIIFGDYKRSDTKQQRF
jgi:hypothetical protein